MRILFIESDRELRSFYGAKLKDEFKGTLDIASTGKEAIKLLRTERPYDVIISDFFLCNGSGLDLLRFKIKNNINCTFIFFCTVKDDIPYPQDEFVCVDKLSFGSLCRELGKLKIC